MDETGSSVDFIGTAEHGSIHFLLSGNWICRRILGQGIIIENNLSKEQIHLHNDSNGWFVIKDGQDKKAWNFKGKQELLYPELIKEN